MPDAVRPRRTLSGTFDFGDGLAIAIENGAGQLEFHVDAELLQTHVRRTRATANNRGPNNEGEIMKHVFFGLVICCLGIWGMIAWWNVFGVVMRGVVPFMCVVFGLVAVLSGLQRLPHEDPESDSGIWEGEDRVASMDYPE